MTHSLYFIQSYLYLIEIYETITLNTDTQFYKNFRNRDQNNWSLTQGENYEGKY